ncbi:unnamed protein product [Durusdinium trenchii]|uniref:Uncharacterized protein n=1 Tax=Durusdinium trenchii TaxID=1381693 RepID=A0ABP0KUB7_9DINO
MHIGCVVYLDTHRGWSFRPSHPSPDPSSRQFQADSGSPLPDWARQRIDSFLTGLASGVDQKTLQELLTLLPTLPAPGPTVLLDEIRLRQPELFERLYESMRRTKQRQSAA